MVIVWNLLSQQSLGNSDLSFQGLFFNQNRNSCISYLPVNAHCWNNQQIPVQKNRQPNIWRCQNWDSADDRSWKSQGFPITHRRADRMASDSVIKSLFQAPWPNINFLMYLLKHLHLLESMALLQSSLQSSCPPAQSVSIHTQNRQDMKRALQWILCTVKEVI